MKVTGNFILSIMTFAIFGIGAAHAQIPLVPILTCHFEKEGVKGGDDRECTAVFSQPLDRVSASDDRPSSPNNLFEVKCDDDTIYSGGGFTKTDEFTNDPQFGFGIVTAINTSILPTYPSVFVDGDFEDFLHGFEDRAARLYFSEDDYILGKCDHKLNARR